MSKKGTLARARKKPVKPMTDARFQALFKRFTTEIRKENMGIACELELHARALTLLVLDIHKEEEPIAAADHLRAIGDACAKRVIDTAMGMSMPPPDPPRELSESEQAFLRAAPDDGTMPASRSHFFDKKGSTTKLSDTIAESRPKIVVPHPSNRKH